MTTKRKEYLKKWKAKNKANVLAYMRGWRERHKKPCPECGVAISFNAAYCIHCTHLRERAQAWNGGTKKTNGYISILSSDHPYATTQGYVLAHRLVMEAHLGRVLLPTEVVHHINGIKTDNRIENLMLFACNGKHLEYHQERKRHVAK